MKVINGIIELVDSISRDVKFKVMLIMILYNCNLSGNFLGALVYTCSWWKY
jgi:hypothetical protein